jgi:hypothetical protein
MKILQWLGFSKPEITVPPKKVKPKRVSVHRPDGTTVVHYACYRQINNGSLVLCDDPDGGQIVAEYAQGAWSSHSVNKRSVRK